MAFWFGIVRFNSPRDNSVVCDSRTSTTAQAAAARALRKGRNYDDANADNDPGVLGADGLCPPSDDGSRKRPQGILAGYQRLHHDRPQLRGIAVWSRTTGTAHDTSLDMGVYHAGNAAYVARMPRSRGAHVCPAVVMRGLAASREGLWWVYNE